MSVNFGMGTIILNKDLLSFLINYSCKLSVQLTRFLKSAKSHSSHGYSSFLVTAKVAEQYVIRKPSVFFFKITAVNVNVVNYIWCLCCLPFKI